MNPPPLSTQSQFKIIVILGVLTAFAPLCIDMYLPALPTIAQELSTTEGHAQLTLATFFAGFAIGQLFFGPIADRFGRKPPLYFGLALFIITTFGCALAPTITSLATLRFFQAVGACAGGVISRAMIRDLFPPDDARWMFSNLMLVTGLAPILAPLLGSSVLIWSTWRAIFWFVGFVGLACTVAVIFMLPESHDPAHATPLAPGKVAKNYLSLLVEPVFMINTLISSLSLAGIFAYIAASSFVFTKNFGLSPQVFSVLFAANAFGFVAGSQVNGRLLRRADPVKVIRIAQFVQIAAGIILVGVSLTGQSSTWALLGTLLPLTAFIGSIGFVLPNSSALAMAPHGGKAGSASALMGTIQFAVAAVATVFMSLMSSHTALAMSITIAVCAVLGFALNQTQRKPELNVAAA